MAAAALLCAMAIAPGLAQTELDGFMREVMARRDDNWERLQEFVLDEREELEVRGPGGARMWGEQRDYAWYLRDGIFVRSPVRVNGASVSEADRRAFEERFLKRDAERRKREEARQAEPGGVDALIRDARQPQFISTAYFLRFRFDQGQYGLVGREMLDGREVLRIEYYPTRLFSDPDRPGSDRPRPDDPYSLALRRLMNKASVVTLWVDRAERQIVRYTFDNVDWDFMPGGWLMRVEDVHASMRMGQPFPGVWLPEGIEVRMAMSLATGPLEFRYTLAYHDYKRAEVTTRIEIAPPGR
jgi:hypothetical protein